jgi:hypothetical protein
MVHVRPRFIVAPNPSPATAVQPLLHTVHECHHRLTTREYHEDIDTKLALLSHEVQAIAGLLTILIERTTRA